MLLQGADELTMDIVESGLVSWEDLVRSVQLFHYGRNANRHDLSLVWTERKGTCSSKHAFLKQVADLNKIDNVNLMMGIYKMSSRNTHGIGDILAQEELDYIPEAHCYLQVAGEYMDITSLSSDFEKLRSDIITEREIMPHQVSEEKIIMHRAFLEQWIEEERIPYSLEEIWKIREACIVALEQNG